MTRKLVIIGTAFIVVSVLLMTSTVNEYFKSIEPQSGVGPDKTDIENTLIVEIATASFGVVLIVSGLRLESNHVKK